MRAKGLFSIFIAIVLMVGPTRLHGEWMQPLLIANGGGAGDDDASLYADGTRAINENRWSDESPPLFPKASLMGWHRNGAMHPLQRRVAAIRSDCNALGCWPARGIGRLGTRRTVSPFHLYAPQ